MSQITQCNHCKAEHRLPSGPYNQVPPGWYHLTRHGGEDTRTTPPTRVNWETDIHLCSPACLIGFAQAEIKSQTPPERCDDPLYDDHIPQGLIATCDLPKGHAGPHQDARNVRRWNTGTIQSDGSTPTCPDCGDVLTNRLNRPTPTYCDTCDREIKPADPLYDEYAAGKAPDPRD